MIMNYEEEAVACGPADVDKALVGFGGVLGIEAGDSCGIEEAGDGFIEGDSVLAEVGGSFAAIMLEGGADWACRGSTPLRPIVSRMGGGAKTHSSR
jgi:hypothetical protein